MCQHNSIFVLTISRLAGIEKKLLNDLLGPRKGGFPVNVHDESAARTNVEQRIRALLRLIAGFGVVGFTVVYFGRVALLAIQEEYWKKLALEQFPAMVGLPAGAVAALFLVLILQAEAGPIEFKAIGFEFKGASGPLVLWVACFLAIAAAIRLVWLP